VSCDVIPDYFNLILTHSAHGKTGYDFLMSLKMEHGSDFEMKGNTADQTVIIEIYRKHVRTYLDLVSMLCHRLFVWIRLC